MLSTSWHFRIKRGMIIAAGILLVHALLVWAFIEMRVPAPDFGGEPIFAMFLDDPREPAKDPQPVDVTPQLITPTPIEEKSSEAPVPDPAP
jgi:hypothetical protein